MLKQIIDKHKDNENCQEIIQDLKKYMRRVTIHDYIRQGLDYFPIELLMTRTAEYLWKLYHVIYYLHEKRFTQTQIANAIGKERTCIYNSLERFEGFLIFDKETQKSYELFRKYMESYD